MSWKKVITSGSKATLATVVGTDLHIPNIPIITDPDARIVVASDTVFKAITQSDLVGVNTLYSAGNGFNLDTSTTPDAFSLNLDQIDHGLIPHNSGGVVHVDWTLTNSGSIHSDNYIDGLYTGSSWVLSNGIAQTNGIMITQSQGGEWTTGVSQSTVTAVGSLTEGSIASSSVFTINTQNSIEALTYTGLANLSGSTSIETLTLSNNDPTGTVSASIINATESANVYVSDGLDISGSFIFNSLEFRDSILQTFSGSHTFGGAASTTSQSFAGDIFGTAGVTSSIGFFGDGAGLFNINPSSISYQNLTMGDGIIASGSDGAAVGTFNFGSDATMSVKLATLSQSNLDNESGLKLLQANNSLDVDNVLTHHIINNAVTETRLYPGSIASASLTSSIIGDHQPQAVWTASTGALNQLLVNITPEAPNMRAITMAKISLGIENYINSQASTADGSVTSMSVHPNASETSVGGLYLELGGNNTMEPELSIKGTAQYDGTNWTGSTSENEALLISHGGTGVAGTTATAAQNRANAIFNPAGGLGNLTIGDSNDTITISGSLIITGGPNNVTTITGIDGNPHGNFSTGDTLIHVGLSDPTVFSDFGIKFGDKITSSNTLIYDSAIDDRGRLGMAYNQTPEFTGISTPATNATNLHFIGVFSGSTGEAVSANADQKGNIRIDDENEIYIYV